MSRDLLLMGVPRAGTTLACKLAGGCRDTLALFEPMDVHAFTGRREDDLERVAGFLREVRQGLREHGTAPSKQRDGLVPDNPFAGRVGDRDRALQVSVGPIRPDHPLGPDFTLVVKHNAAFIALLPELATCFECVAIVRNPVAALRSWASVPLPVREGRLPAGERLDPTLAAILDAETDAFERQLHLLEWLFGRIHRFLPEDRVVRYEDLVGGNGEPLYRALGLRPAAPTPLQLRGAAIAADAPWQRLATLPSRAGAWRHWYGDAEIAAALGDRA